jgi:hypothetical protein
MADHFIDPVNGNNANTGHTMDLAWQTFEYAIESGSLVAGDIVWIRRTVAEIPVSDIAPAYCGTPASLLKFVGWPRPSVSITSTWTAGSTTVSVSGTSMTRESHCSRYITGPNGYPYVITQVTSSTGFIIDREYSGTTSTGTVIISQDEDYDLAQTIDDSSWTIKKSNWNTDTTTLPVIDFNDGAYQLVLNSDHWHSFRNIEFKDSSDTAGIIRTTSCSTEFIGCLIKQSAQNTLILALDTITTVLKRCIVEGSGSGSSQRGIDLNGTAKMKDSAVYNCGGVGIDLTGRLFFENLNIGVEQANGGNDISLYLDPTAYGRDLKLGGTNGYITTISADSSALLYVENFQKILGNHRTYCASNYFEKLALPDGIANKKISDNVIKSNLLGSSPAVVEEFKIEILVHEIEADTSTKSYRYWIFNNAMGTLNSTTAKDNIFLKVEYIAAYTNTTEYCITNSYSSQTSIANAANSDDWDYLEVTGITPAVASKVRLTICASAYSKTGTIYIDPCPVIS